MVIIYAIIFMISFLRDVRYRAVRYVPTAVLIKNTGLRMAKNIT
jgi:hypothetical protein